MSCQRHTNGLLQYEPKANKRHLAVPRPKAERRPTLGGSRAENVVPSTSAAEI